MARFGIGIGALAGAVMASLLLTPTPLAAQELETALPGLTQLAKRHDGTFPAGQVRDTIDGRDVFLSHRSEEMPVWGNWFEYDITAGGPRHIGNARLVSLVRA